MDEANTNKVVNTVLQVIIVLSYRSTNMELVVVKLKRFVSHYKITNPTTPQIYIVKVMYMVHCVVVVIIKV